MRILFCTNSIGSFGGIEHVTIVKANALADIPGNTVGICFTDKGQYPRNTIHPVSDKIKVYNLRVKFWDLYPINYKNILLKAPAKYIKLRRNLKRVIKKFDPDVVITTGQYEKFALASLRLKKAVKVRELHFNSQYRSIAGGGFFFKIVEFFEYHILNRMFDMNLVLTKEDLETNFKGRSRFDYQHNPCTFQHSQLKDYVPNGQRENIIVYVGRLAPEKNVSALIRIWHKLGNRRGDWKLWIVGDGAQKKMIEDAVKNLNLSESVSFLGFRSDVQNVLAKCRLLALTSFHEGLSLSIVEAMDSGVVPISFATPYGPMDVINDGINGVLVDYLNEDQFADKLADLISHDDEIIRLSKGAMERSKDFNLDKIATEIMTKYQNLIDKKHMLNNDGISKS